MNGCDAAVASVVLIERVNVTAEMESPESRGHQESTDETHYLSPGPAKRARTGVPEDPGDRLAGGEGEGEEEEEGDSESNEGDVTAQVDAFFADFDVDYQRQKKRLLSDISSGVKMTRRKNSLPPHLHSVMGSANLRLARGDRTDAIELCMEVIRQAPGCSEPYLTLATIYEDQGNHRKLLQILLIAAHLKRSDVTLWAKTADLAVEHGQLSLALQCFSKACRLDPSNIRYPWRKAELYDQLGEYKKALETYDHLLKSLPEEKGATHMMIMKEMARLYHRLGDTEKAVELLQCQLEGSSSHVDDELINLYAELCISLRLSTDAFRVITSYYGMADNPPEGISSGLGHSQPLDSVDTPSREEAKGSLASPPFSLSEALRMTMSSEEEGEGEREREGPVQPSLQAQPSSLALSVPGEMPVDLRSKLAVCLIHMGKPLPEGLLSPIYPHPEDYGDLFLDVADAYSDNGDYSQALPLLTALTHTQRYSQAGVWLKHAECLHMLGDLEAAAMSYSKVVALAPNHTETRITLATLYTQLGLVDDALAMLEEPRKAEEQEVTSDEMEGTKEREQTSSSQLPDISPQKPSRAVPIAGDSPFVAMAIPQYKERQVEDVRLLLHKYSLLVSEGRLNEYVEAGVELLSSLFKDVFSRPDVRSIMHLSSRKIQLKLKGEGREVGEAVEEGEVEGEEERKGKVGGKRAQREKENLLKVEEWWKVFLTTCRGLYQLGPAHYQWLAHLIFCAKALKKFDSPSLEMTFACFGVSALRLIGEDSLLVPFFKPLCRHKNLEVSTPWNVLNTFPVDMKIQKFVLRLFFKNPSNRFLMRICANYSLASGSYALALSQYELAYRQCPSDYLLCLCIAVTYLDLASQNRAVHRNALVTQALGFLHKYVRLRGNCQEVMYNIGRVFHQLGVVHIACHFYKQVLCMEPECQLPQWCRVSDLHREAAFNLSLIYKGSGNSQLALHVLRQYCTI